jgi:hypothetical protein
MGSNLSLHFETSTLFASLLWGTIGVGFFIFGKKQGSAAPLIGGVVLVGLSYLVTSALWMSVWSIAVIAGIYFWSKHAY